MFDGQGKNCTYTYVSIFKNKIPLHNFSTLFKYRSRNILFWWWYLMCFAKREAAVANVRTASVCVDSCSCTKRGSCLDLLAWQWFPARSPSHSHAHKWSVETNTVATAALFGEVLRMRLDVMYLPLSCLGHFQMLSSLTCRTQECPV